MNTVSLYKDRMIINFLNFNPGSIDFVKMLMLGESSGDLEIQADVEKFLQTQGVCTLDLSDELVLVYKDGDPSAEEILKANLGELPEFLSSEFCEIRLLAKWKLDALMNDLDR